MFQKENLFCTNIEKYNKKFERIMNTGQTLFSIGALLLLSLTILKMNNFILINDTVMQESKFSILAVSLATSIIEEASKKAYDVSTVDEEAISVSSLTDYPLGYETGEIKDSSQTFNDFDDYNGYEYHYDYLPSANFDLKCFVYYIDPQYNFETKVGYRTWHKKMDVIVSSPSMKDTVKMSTIYSYWYFR